MSYVNPPTIVAANSAHNAAINTIVVCTVGSFTVTLPTPIGNAGRSVVIKNLAAVNNNITVASNAGETINGSVSSYVMKCFNQSATFTSNGTNWYVTAVDWGGSAATVQQNAMANLGGISSTSGAGGGDIITATGTTTSSLLIFGNNNVYKTLQLQDTPPYIGWTTGAMNGALHTSGNVTLTAAFPTVNTISTAGGNSLVTLPSAASTDVPGKLFFIGKSSSDANRVQINTASSQLITGAASANLWLNNQNDFALIQANNQSGTNRWHLIASSPAFTSHLIGTTAAPAAVKGDGAGASGTASVSGTDMSGTITITTDAADTPSANATIATVTFSRVYNTTPRVVFSPANTTANTLAYGVVQINQSDVTAEGFIVKSGATPLTATTAATYVYNYVVVQ